MLAFLCAAAAICYAQRQVVAVAKEPIQVEFGLSKNQIGWILAAFFIGYSLFQVPLGWVGDAFGARRSLAICVGLSALATSLFPLCGTFALMVAMWAICGSAQAGLFPIAARLIVGAFPPTRRALASGVLASSMSIGAAAMSALAGKLLAMAVAWKLVVLLAAAPGLVWVGAFLASYRDPPPASSSEATGANDAPEVGNIFTSPALWLVCAQQFLRAAGYIFFVSWFSTYLLEAKSVSIEEAGRLNGLPLLAVVVGAPLGGFLSDLLLSHTGSRRIAQQAMAIVSLLACAALILPALWVNDPLGATALISVGSFCAALCGPIGYAVTMHLAGERVGTVFGVMNMSGNIGAVLFPLAAAELRTSTGDWNLVLYLFAGIYLAAAICWMLINPNRLDGRRGDS